MVKIFSLEGCVPCKQAKYILNNKKIEYQTLDFNEYRKELVNKGFTHAPVFEIDGQMTGKLYRAVDLITNKA